MSRLFIALALLSLSHAAAAFTPDLATLTQAPLVLLPAAEVREAVEQDKHDPLRFASAAALALDARNGSWDEPQAGTARWRLRLKSEGAQSLHLHIKQLQLPAGAELWFYGDAGQDLQGPLSAGADGVLWSPLVRSAEAVLEARMPASARDAFALRIVEAYHGFREFAGVQPKGRFGDSQSCNVDVACPAGNSWGAEIRSTVHLQIAGFVCSGTLVNNVRQDDRALLLTANHCGVSSSNVGSVRAYFNMQKSSCGSSVNGPVTDNLRGLRFLASDSNSDFSLFELESAPPSRFNAYYAGWDVRTDTNQSSGVSIHHPAGDDKKISTYNTPPSRADDQLIGTALSGFRVDAWRVVWADGTTQGGSSGAGLWNQNRQLIGVLSGGAASCTSRSDPDFFGRLERAWLANNASNGQLKAHLDPGNAGCLSISGKNPGAASALNCSGGSGSSSNDSDGGRFGGTTSLTLLATAALAALRRRKQVA